MSASKWIRSLGAVIAAFRMVAAHADVLFSKASDVGGSVGQTAGTFGFYFTPNQDILVTRLGAFDYSFYSHGSAVLEIWKQGASDPEASATIVFGGSSQSESSFNYVFSDLGTPVVLSPGPDLLNPVHYLLVWKDNQGDAIQPFASGAHVTVHAPVADYGSVSSSPGLVTLNYTYIFTGSSLSGINPWNEQHVSGWEKSVIAGTPPYMDINMEFAAVPEPIGTSVLTGVVLLAFSASRRGLKRNQTRL